MTEVQDYITRIINQQRKWGYHLPSLIRQGGSIEFIHAAERQIGFQFNNELTALYQLYDGTELDTNTACGKQGLIPIHNFLKIEDAIDYYKTWIGFKDGFINADENLAPGDKLFPFLEDGAGNCYWVDLNENTEHYGQVFWTNSYGDQPDYHFDSVANFLKVICESHESGIICVDEEGYLKEDYRKFGHLARKYNPKCKRYWDLYLSY